MLREMADLLKHRRTTPVISVGIIGLQISLNGILPLHPDSRDVVITSARNMKIQKSLENGLILLKKPLFSLELTRTIFITLMRPDLQCD